jgi:DNA-binding transcriptional MerR regulator
MNQFSIRDIENMCGVKAHTLRIWEQRYNLFTPKRKKSLHRTYDCNDLKELLRIAFLYHNGYKISKIAELTPEQISQEVARLKATCCNFETFVQQLTEASVVLDKEKFEEITDDLVKRIGLEKCILYVFYPFLQRIGLLWMTNHVIPAQEHFSSHIIQKKIIAGIDKLPPVQDKTHNVVIFAPPGELHEIPLLVVNYLLRKQGVFTTYFGTGVATETLLYYNQLHPVTHFYTHLVTILDNPGLNDFVCSLTKSFPDHPVTVSGPACNCVRQKPGNFRQLCSLEEVIGFTRSFKTS